MDASDARRTLVIILPILASISTCSCSSRYKPLPQLKSEIVQEASGASFLWLSPSGRFLTAHMGVGFKVLDQERGNHNVFQKGGWPVGGADDRGEIYYVREESGVWHIRSSMRGDGSTVLPLPPGKDWRLLTAERTAKHAVVVFVEAESTNAHAISLSLGDLAVAATRAVRFGVGLIGRQSVCASSGEDAVYWMRPAGKQEVSVVAVDPATLQDRWVATLRDPVQGAPTSPGAILSLTGDGKYVFTIVAGTRRGIADADGLYVINAEDGSVLSGPTSEHLHVGYIGSTYRLVPVPGQSAVAVLTVINLRDDSDKFGAVYVVDVINRKRVGAIQKGPRTHAIAVKKSGPILIAPVN